MERWRVELEENLECQFGLLTELLSAGMVTKRQISELKASRESYEQNRRLLDIISSLRDQQKVEGLLEALRQTKQEHLAAFLECSEGILFI